MRTITLVAGLMLATALVSFAPAADAAQRCLPGDVAEVCIPDRCDFQSDCCDRTLGSGFWCPEDG